MASNDSDRLGSPQGGADAAGAVPAASAPLIGVTTYLEQAQTGVWDVRAAFLPKVYLDAVTDAGGIAVLLPPQPASPEVARRVLGALDGLVVSGGADVDPARYGQEPHERTGAPRTDRDEWEDALFAAAIELELPFLGICRGAQLLNVALGGTLVQHLPDVVGTEAYQPAPAVFGETAPADILDEFLPSFYLQGAGDGALAGEFALAGALQRRSLQAHADAVGLRLHFPVLGRERVQGRLVEPVGAGA